MKRQVRLSTLKPGDRFVSYEGDLVVVDMDHDTYGPNTREFNRQYRECRPDRMDVLRLSDGVTRSYSKSHEVTIDVPVVPLSALKPGDRFKLGDAVYTATEPVDGWATRVTKLTGDPVVEKI